MSDPLTSLLHASHLLEPAELPAAVAVEARALGSEETVLYLTDYEQTVLVPLPGEGVPARRELPVEGTLAGLAFRRVELESSTSGIEGHRLWVPLLDGVERLGVAEMVLRSAPDAEQVDRIRAFVTLVAELVVARDAYSDVFTRARRRRTMSLAADAVGHGLSAAVLATVAVSAYRHARRHSLGLPDMAAAVDRAIAGQIGHSQFATAVLVRLELDAGRLRWIDAGHPDPLIMRGAALVRPPHCPPARPLGLQAGAPTVCETRLEPGDRLLLYTDGITEARSPDGEFFGERRLADLVSTAVAAGDPTPETVRRLMHSLLTHQAGRLQDDASIVVLEWRTDADRRVLL